MRNFDWLPFTPLWSPSSTLHKCLLLLSSSRFSKFWTVWVHQEVDVAISDVLDTEAVEKPVTVAQSPELP
jgi:hypothetical protein